KLVPEKIFESTYWSSVGGLPDLPENYKKVTYEITQTANGTKLTVVQENNGSEKEKNHSEQNWAVVLTGLKKLVEGK
ncbi:MAG: SRPBCC domain-containing protein, partial [Bacteroidota bacterium]|nr:SRPBCC domain-containing protein [Bacteroidota bacterium]